MTVRLGSKLPKDEDRNGLNDAEREFLRDPGRARLAIVVLSTSEIVDKVDDYDRYPKVAIRAIELVSGEDTGTLRNILQRTHEERTGDLELPADWTEVLVDMVTPPLPGTGPV